MRCPKCNFISFDDHSTCAKCSNDLSALIQDLQGTGTETNATFFLSSVVEAPELGEDSFSASQAVQTDDDQVNHEDTMGV